MKNLAAFALIAGITASASAQIAPVHPIDSIDFTVQNASRVVTGNLQEYEKTGQAWQTRNVKVGVKETLKGEATALLETKLQAPDTTFDGWKATKALLLVAVNSGRYENASAIDLSAKNLAVVTEDLKLLRTPDEILKWARESIARTRDLQGDRGFELKVPADKFKGTSLENVGVDYGLPKRALVRVPANRKLLDRAMADIRSNNEEQRIIGIHELQLFKTKEGIDALTGLLSDESDWKAWDGLGSAYIAHYRYNAIRQQAYYALKSMGVFVAKGRFEDPEVEDAQIVAVMWEFPGAADFPRLPKLINLRAVYLTGQRLDDATWATIGRLGKVEHLSLDGSNIDDKTLAGLSGMDSLTYLSLRNTTITDGGLIALARLKNLRTLDVGPGITDQGIAALHKLRSNIQVRKDEFAFLTPLHLRRIDMLTWSTMNRLPDGTPYQVRLGVRGFALVFHSYQEPEVLAALKKNLTSRGWKATTDGYQRDAGRVFIDSKPYVVDRIYVNPALGTFTDLRVEPGESCIVVTLNRMPPK